ncbi:MAG: dihydroorotate dehydrogenase [Paucimonas sp.]|nr:dihydroorotate dehydrogenase [Paucimonas sp.]
MSNRLASSIGALALKNPVIAGSGEATMTESGIRAALAAGVGAVMAKSTNESEAAKTQLNHTDYMLLDSRWKPIPWSDQAPADAQLFCRSGLQPENFDSWLEKLARLDQEAQQQGSYVIGHLILNDVEKCAQMAERMQEAGLRAITVLVAAVHGDQAAKGAIAMIRDPQGIRDVVGALRKRVRVPLWIKLPGQTEDVSLLAAAARDAGADAVNFIDRTLAMVPDLETRAPFLGTIAALGGTWSLPIACRWLAQTRKRLGPDFPLIGTNGARDGYDVARMLLAGAHGVEMTSAVMVHGVGVLATAIQQLDSYLESQGVSAQDIIGEAADKLTAYTDQPSRPGRWKSFINPEAVD